MINFILMLIGFLSPTSSITETTNPASLMQQNRTPDNTLDNRGGLVGGNTGQLPPPFIQP